MQDPSAGQAGHATPIAGATPSQAALAQPWHAGPDAANPVAPFTGVAAPAPHQATPVASQASGLQQQAAPPPPADQLGQAVAALHVSGGAGGHVSIRLNPQELGGVEIQLRRSQDGGTALSLAVERPETLRALQADLSHLHQALDRAGLPAEQRSVTLHLAAADGASAPLAGGGSGAAGQDNSSGGGASAGHQRPGQPGARQPVPAAAEAAAQPPTPAGARAGWRPSGVDITA